MRLVIAGGGTGGHLFPAIAVAEEVMRRDRENAVLFIGTSRGLEARVLPKEGWQVAFVSAGALKGRGLFGKIGGIFRMTIGTMQSMRHIGRFSPDAVLGMGGYVSAAAVIAGRMRGIRTALHEQNAMPGLANRVLSRVADRIFITVPSSRDFFRGEKVVVTGNPLRRRIAEAFAKGGRKERKAGFTVLVFGGSRGARRLNDAALGAFCDGSLSDLAGLSLIHQTGGEDRERVLAAYREKGVNAEVPAFIDDMAAAYLSADLVVCRAGATTITELLAAGKPALLVPYPFAADDHQRLNAEAVAAGGGAKVIADADLTAGRLAAEIRHYFERRAELEEMGSNAGKMAKTDGAQRVVDALVELTEKKGRS